MVEVVVSRLGLDSASKAYVVVLQEKDGQRILPIWIGQPEAESIVIHVHNIKRPRPLTHDLCRSLIMGLGASLRRVQITRVDNNTYFAEMHISRGDTVVQIDARPSDSIAIALRLSAPIFADESLLASYEESETDSEGNAIDQPRSEGTPLSPDDLKAYLEKLRPEDFGEFNL